MENGRPIGFFDPRQAKLKQLLKFDSSVPKVAAMVSPGASTPDFEPARQSAAAARPDGVVLLVEDEDSLGDLLVHLLRRSHIRTVRAADGMAALAVFAEHKDEIVLAFVDCRLPDLDGGDLCRELRRLAPGLPLLLTSGRDQRALVHSLSAGGRTTFLAKPYMPADVVRQVNALLSRGA